jgi:hypothetical protein
MQLNQIWTGLLNATKNNFESVCSRCRLTRQLGLFYNGKMKKSNIPPNIYQQWDKHDREHINWRANLYAEVPEETFEKWLASGKKTLKFCEGQIRGKAQSYRKKRQLEERAREVIKHQGLQIYTADIKDVSKLKSGVKAAAIITDPPYPFEFIDCWSELVKFAGRTLQNRGWLVAMSGQRYLPDVLERMMAEASSADLRYCWTIALHTPGQCTTSWLGGGDTAKGPDILEVGINVQWKPIFVFIKGKDRPVRWRLGSDFIISPNNDKEYHEWGQNEAVFDILVDSFTEKTELIVDPFLGGGTTAVSALKSGRGFEGFDIDEACVNISLSRVSDMLKSKNIK